MSTSSLMQDGSYVELLKLQKLFQANFSLRSSTSSVCDVSHELVTPEDAHTHECVSMAVNLRPTAPEFDLSQLGAEQCIRLKLTLHRTGSASIASAKIPSQDASPSDTAAPSDKSATATTPSVDSSRYTLCGASDIDIENSDIPPDVKLVIKKALLTFLAKYRSVLPYAVYESLKFLDQELSRILELCASRRISSAKEAGPEALWSSQEQKR